MKIISLVLSTALMSGCASMVSQSSRPVAMTSNPTGTAFTITNKKGEKVYTGTTPSTVHLISRAGYFEGETYTLHFIKAGYAKTGIQEKTAILGTSLNHWYWANLLWGPLAPIGFLVVDPETGAMFKLPKFFTIDLSAPVSATKLTASEPNVTNPNEGAELKGPPAPTK
ncbi:MAG: hypothetical protein NTY50_06490 [Methylobacter sp.]|nr:hypothetical protein [Methylobacter sp.]